MLDILCLGLLQPTEHGLSQKAVEIGSLFGFPITNSMVVTWIVALGLILFAQVSTRKMSEVPGGAQNLLEWLLEGLYGLLESIIGRHLVEKTFWFFATIFIFILAANWSGLIPGVGTIGWGHQTAHGFVVEQPLFRAALMLHLQASLLSSLQNHLHYQDLYMILDLLTLFLRKVVILVLG